MYDSCEPSMFSLEQLLFAVSADTRTASQTLRTVLPMMREVYDREKAERDSIKVRRRLHYSNNSTDILTNPFPPIPQTAGVHRTLKVPGKGSAKKPITSAIVSAAGKGTGPRNAAAAAEDVECYTCRANLYVSWIQSDDEVNYCLQHGLKQIRAGRLKAAACRLLYAYSLSEVEQLIERIRSRTLATTTSTLAASGDGDTKSNISEKTATTTATTAATKRKLSGKGRYEK